MPGSDPFTFTAHGEPWVVQSWLVSAVMGVAEDVFGIGAVRLLMGLLTLGVFAITWRLTRPTKGLLARVAIAAIPIVIGIDQWSERPLLVGLIALGLTVLAGEGQLDARWLIPIGWVWVNSHGSFPLGLAYLLVVALGRRLDRLDASDELRALRWLGGGILLGALNPLGPRLLLFPLDLLQRQDVLRHVAEWQAPDFLSLSSRAFLGLFALAILALVRRPRWRGGLVVVVFGMAALLGARNIAVAAIVFLPVVSGAWPEVGGLRADARTSLSRMLAVVGIVAVVLVSVIRLSDPAFDLRAYPTAQLRLLDRGGVDLGDVHLATIDTVGNLIGLRDGPNAEVFFDDRFDMFPESVSADAFALNEGRPRSTTILDERGIDLVLWPRNAALSAILGANPDWRSLDDDPRWLLFCRVGVPLSADLGTC